jgi:phospholipid-binding lipoprotein MlaA
LAADPVSQEGNVRLRNSLYVLSQLDARAGLLRQEALMEGATFDRYVLIRDAYLQYRLHLVYDGDPPDQPMPEDDYYEEEDGGDGQVESAPTEADGSSSEQPATPTQPQVERDTRVPGRIPGTPTVPLDMGLPGLNIIK